VKVSKYSKSIIEMELLWSLSVSLPIAFAVEAHLAERHFRRWSALKT